MDKNKTEQLTFGADEKETLEKLSLVESSVGQNIKERNQRELIATKYYSEFVINTKNGPVTLNNVFITAERDQQGDMSYHFRWIREDENGEQTIEENMVVDKDGKVYATGGLKDYLGDAEIDLDGIIAENDDIEKGRLRGISEKADKKEIEKSIKEKGDKNVQKEEKPEEQIEEDIGGEENLEISYYRKIKDNNLDEQIKKDFSGYEEKGIAYSKTKNAFIMVGKKDGKFQMVDGFEPAQPTLKTVISINENGKEAGKKVPHALMKTNNSRKEMSITIGQYGYIEAGTVDRLPCNKRIEMQVREEGETQNERTSPQLSRAVRTQGTEALHNWAEEHEEKNENMKQGDTRKEDITEEIENDGKHIEKVKEDEKIPGTNMKWKDFARQCGYREGDSIGKAYRRFEDAKKDIKNKDKSNEDLVNVIIEEEVYGYMHCNKEHELSK